MPLWEGDPPSSLTQQDEEDYWETESLEERRRKLRGLSFMVLISLQILNLRIFKFSNHSSEVIITKRMASPSIGKTTYDQFWGLQIEKMHHYFPVLSENMALLSSRQWVDAAPAAEWPVSASACGSLSGLSLDCHQPPACCSDSAYLLLQPFRSSCWLCLWTAWPTPWLTDGVPLPSSSSSFSDSAWLWMQSLYPWGYAK